MRSGSPPLELGAGSTGATGAAGVVQSVVAGTNISVDSSDPANPIVTNTMKDNSVVNALIFG